MECLQCGTTKNDTLTYKLFYNFMNRKTAKKINRTSIPNATIGYRSIWLTYLKVSGVAFLQRYMPYCNVNYFRSSVYSVFKFHNSIPRKSHVVPAALKYLMNWHDLYQFSTLYCRLRVTGKRWIKTFFSKSRNLFCISHQLGTIRVEKSVFKRIISFTRQICSSDVKFDSFLQSFVEIQWKGQSNNGQYELFCLDQKNCALISRLQLFFRYFRSLGGLSAIFHCPSNCI